MTQFSELHDASSERWTQLSSFRALVFLLLTQNCAGRIQVVGPSQPVMATVGDDVVLTCRLEPAADASDMSVEWYREDLDPRYVFVWWDGEELEDSKHPAYKGRTSLLVNKLELGDVSLKLSKVKLSDKGKYTCFIPRLGQGSTVELVVGIDSFTIIMAVCLAAAIILLIPAVVLFVHTRRKISKMKNWLTTPITLLEVDKYGDYIRLKNISDKEIKLGGWKLQLHRNNRDKDTYTFKKPLKLKAGGILSLRHPRRYSEHPYDVDLLWWDMTHWMPSDQQQINLISNSGDKFNLL